jgi:hypothetical protein
MGGKEMKARDNYDLHQEEARELEMIGKRVAEVLGNNSPDYWTRLEHTYAGMAMQGLIASKRGLNIETDMYDIPYYSQMLAHALVEKMKEQADSSREG